MITSRALAIACSLSLLTVACKKDDAKPLEQKQADPKPAEPTPPPPPVEPKPPEPKPPEPAPPAAMTAAEYETRSLESFDKFSAIFTASGKDCDKLATAINKLIDNEKVFYEAAIAYEKANPDVKKAVEKKTAAKQKDFERKAGPAFE